MSLLDAGGQKLEYKTKELLEILRKNRAAHEKDYKAAKAVYDRIHKVVKAFHAKMLKENPGIELLVDLSAPSSFLQSYDQVIRMLELTVKETIELDGRSFSQYVMDEWHWSEKFRNETVTYLSSARMSSQARRKR